MQIFHFENPRPFQLESGQTLPRFQLEYNTFGTLKPDFSNVVWVCHALTGNADVEDWWGGLFGEGKLFNPEEHFVICANVLGGCYGSTGPLSVNPETGSPYYHDFPPVTIRDIVRGLDLLREHLKIQKIHTLIGGSLGGQQAMEWTIQRPDLVENLILVCTNAKHSPWGVAFNESQRMAIAADATWQENRDDAGTNGLKAARAVAMLSYRNYETYDRTQQEVEADKLDGYRAASYQQYQGEKLTRRFNAFTYWALSKAMDSHDIGRGRESMEEVLKSVKTYTQVISVTTDILFPSSEQRFIVRQLPNVTYEEIYSTYGHDGFLVETEKLERAIRAFYHQKERKQVIINEEY